MFRRTVQSCWLATPFACFPFTSPPMCHLVPSGFKPVLPIITPGPGLSVSTFLNMTGFYGEKLTPGPKCLYLLVVILPVYIKLTAVQCFTLQPSMYTYGCQYYVLYILYRVIQNDCRGFNNLSYTTQLR